MRGKVLLVDDSKELAKFVRMILRDAGFEAVHALSADAAFARLKEESVDLVLLDVDLGGISGLHVLELLRKEPGTQTLPVMLLTVQGSEAQKVRGLGAGADDYLVKPFSAKELVARIEALLRRARPAAQQEALLEGGGVRVDFNRHEVSVKGSPVRVTLVEFNLLALLMRRKGFVHSYGALADALSEGKSVMTSETVYAHVKNLRRALGAAGKNIETVRDVGYKFVEA